MSTANNKIVNFMGIRYIAFLFSFSFIAISLFTWVKSGATKYGLDFLGGTELVVRFDDEVTINKIREALKKNGISKVKVQEFESGISLDSQDEENKKRDFSIKLKASEEDAAISKLKSALSSEALPKSTILKEDFVGPIIGEQIRIDGIKAVIASLIAILIYISVRFEWRFAMGAIIALVHDVTITTGIFILVGHEISAAVLAALLTIIGYSLNDTIIVFDRVRENMTALLKKKHSGNSLNEIINTSVTQTLSRTLLTSLTTLFVVTVLWLFGGGAISELAFALVIGIVVGTYSSIFVACPVVVLFAEKKK